jgi:hypothetical protein
MTFMDRAQILVLRDQNIQRSELTVDIPNPRTSDPLPVRFLRPDSSQNCSGHRQDVMKLQLIPI